MGAALRAARTEKRLSIERAADELKIRQEFLMRMESDEFDFLAPAYARGFLGSYVRYLGLDDRPFLEEFDRRHGGGGIDAAQIAAVDQEGPKKPFRDHRSISLITVFVAAAAGILLLLALVGIFAPEPKPEKKGPAVARTSSTPSPIETVKDKKKKKGSPKPTPSPSSTLLDEGIELAVSVDEGACWVDVEADGERVFAETLDVGDSETFEAKNDMVVILGAPSTVTLTLNDHPVDSLDTQGPGAVKLTLPDELYRLGIREESPLTETPAETPSPTPTPSP
jgi:cytoskeleton protein RodZ